jgi:processive 1,2-diacylglycerol beta-glucosyltransferase
MTTYSPTLWDWFYRATERRDFSKETFSVMRRPEIALAKTVADFQPDAVVSTYPLYPYFLKRLSKKGVWNGKVFTVVTDSIEINNAWLQAPSDYWLVTDAHTRRVMHRRGVPEESLVETGFPVAPVFQVLEPLHSRSPTDPFRILYFATGRKPQIEGVGEPVLRCEGTHLTMILGRNFRRLYPSARRLQKKYPGRVRILGWSKRIPQHLCEHHLAIGKAGGATVHECIAASIPMLIHHLVPGQEEGNLALLRAIDGGDLADTSEKLERKLQSLLRNNRRGWKRWKRNLAKYSRPHSATVTAQFILEKLAAEN